MFQLIFLKDSFLCKFDQKDQTTEEPLPINMENPTTG